jgi:nicotinate phosphoribosyltransferase
VQEVRWTLDINGFRNVRIFVSGGIDEEEARELADLADGFGVGTSIAFPPSVDLALDIVEVEGRPLAKRGKLPGRKQVYRCKRMHDLIVPFGKELERCPVCGDPTSPLLRKVMESGELTVDLPSAREIRSKLLERLEVIRSKPDLAIEPVLQT